MIEKVMAGLQMGKSIYEVLKDETTLGFILMLLLWLQVGEETAHLEEAMGNIIAMYRRRTW